jgi:hypothetical protein
MFCYYFKYFINSVISWIQFPMNSKDNVYFLLCCLPFGNAGGLQILCCQGFEVKHYDFTLDALTLKTSGVCNVGVNFMDLQIRRRTHCG